MKNDKQAATGNSTFASKLVTLCLGVFAAKAMKNKER